LGSIDVKFELLTIIIIIGFVEGPQITTKMHLKEKKKIKKRKKMSRKRRSMEGNHLLRTTIKDMQMLQLSRWAAGEIVPKRMEVD